MMGHLQTSIHDTITYGIRNQIVVANLILSPDDVIFFSLKERVA